MADFTRGDRVKVTMEGVVRAVHGAVVSVNDDEGKWLGEVNYLKNPVEKIEPPVEVFEPGDIVRHKESGGIYLITKSWGSVAVGDGTVYGPSLSPAKGFTSDFWEKVELG